MIITGELLEALEQLDPVAKSAFIKIVKNLEKAVGEVVRREDFSELKKAIADLTEAQKDTERSLKELAEFQKRTEQRLEELAEAQKRTEKRVEELAEAQKITEQQLKELAEAQKRTEKRVEELAEAQKITEQRLEELAEAQKRTEKRVEELAEAQKITEQRLEELAEAQKRTEKRIEELAEAQKRTEEELRKLSEDHKKTREQIGSLSHAFGYYLENQAYKYLPSLLQSRYSLTVEGDLIRTYLEIGQTSYEEINIYGYARKNGEKYIILGECKSQLKKADIDKFLKKVERLKKLHDEKPFVVFVTHQPTFEAMKHIQRLQLPLFYSYQFS